MSGQEIGVGVMIVRGGKVLLGLRNSDAKKAKSALHGEGTWTMPGGKIRFGEKCSDTCAREVLEETGLKIVKRKLKLISLSDDIVSDAHFLTAGFLCRDFQGKPKACEPERIVEWRWFGLKKLPKNIFSASKNVLNHYFAKRIY